MQITVPSEEIPEVVETTRSLVRISMPHIPVLEVTKQVLDMINNLVRGVSIKQFVRVKPKVSRKKDESTKRQNYPKHTAIRVTMIEKTPTTRNDLPKTRSVLSVHMGPTVQHSAPAVTAEFVSSSPNEISSQPVIIQDGISEKAQTTLAEFEKNLKLIIPKNLFVAYRNDLLKTLGIKSRSLTYNQFIGRLMMTIQNSSLNDSLVILTSLRDWVYAHQELIHPILSVPAALRLRSILAKDKPKVTPARNVPPPIPDLETIEEALERTRRKGTFELVSPEDMVEPDQPEPVVEEEDMVELEQTIPVQPGPIVEEDMVEPEPVPNVTITQPETTIKELSLKPQLVLDPTLSLDDMTLQYERMQHSLSNKEKAIAMNQIANKKLVDSLKKLAESKPEEPVEPGKPVKRVEPEMHIEVVPQSQTEEDKMLERAKRRKQNEERIQRLAERWQSLPPEEKERRRAEAAKQIQIRAATQQFEKAIGRVPTFGQRLDDGQLAITASKTLVSPKREIISDEEYTILNNVLENVNPDTALIISSLERLSNLGLLREWTAKHPVRTQELIDAHFLTRTNTDVELNTTEQFAPFSGPAHRLA